jgi:Fe-S-cluster containining protein
MDWLEEQDAQWETFLGALEEFKSEEFPSFCLQECPKTCCDLSRIELRCDLKELQGLMGKDLNREIAAPYEIAEGVYRFAEGLCPNYQSHTRRCNIWNQAQRPKICGEFPFGPWHDSLYRNKELRISPACAFGPEHPLFETLRQCASFYGVDVIKIQSYAQLPVIE